MSAQRLCMVSSHPLCSS